MREGCRGGDAFRVAQLGREAFDGLLETDVGVLPTEDAAELRAEGCIGCGGGGCHVSMGWGPDAVKATITP